MKTKLLLSLFLLVFFSAVSDIKAEKILFLTNQNPTTNQSDLTVIEYLESEAYDVVVKLSQSFNADTDLAGVDCIFISEAIGSGDPAALYTAENAGQITIPIINAEPYAYSAGRLPWIANPGTYEKGATDYGRIWLTEEGAAHPIAVKAGYTTATTSGDDAIVVLEKKDAESAVLPKMIYVRKTDVTKGVVIGWDGATGEGVVSKALMFAIEKGTEVVSGKVLPARRIQYFIANGTNNVLTEAGKKLLKASIEWGIEGKDYNPNGIIQGKADVNFIYANNYLTINENNVRLDLFTVDGRLIKTLENAINYDCSTMSKGVYIARFSSGQKMDSAKIIVK
jgi:hypothetical protein